MIADARDHIFRCLEAKQHTLAVLGVANAVVHQVPVHAVRATIVGVTTVARLPVLIAERRIIECPLTLIARRLYAGRIIGHSLHTLLLEINYVEYIREVGRQIYLTITHRHSTRAVALDRQTHTNPSHEVQVIIQFRLIGICLQLLNHSLVIHDAHIVRTRLRGNEPLPVTLHIPDTAGTTIGFIERDGTHKALRRSVDHTHGVGIHPSLLQLRCRHLETAKVVRHKDIATIGRTGNTTQGIATVA